MAALIDRQFEKFLGGPTLPPERRVYISLDKRGLFSINAACYKLMGKPRMVYLHYNRANDTIAIEPVDGTHLPAAFTIRATEWTWYIPAAPFCRHFGIRLDATQRFISPDLRDGVLYLKLRETVTISRQRKKK